MERQAEREEPAKETWAREKAAGDPKGDAGDL